MIAKFSIVTKEAIDVEVSLKDLAFNHKFYFG
jgi:hypothetical protein